MSSIEDREANSDSKSKRMPNAPLSLGVVLLIAAALRIFALGAQDYGLDELHSLANSAGRRAEMESVPMGRIVAGPSRATDFNAQSSAATAWRNMADDTHPPLYFVVLYFWRRLVGDVEVAVRLLPVLFSLLSILPILWIFRSDNRSGRASSNTADALPSNASTVEGESARALAGLMAALWLAVAHAHIWIAQESRPYSLSLLLTGCGFALLTLGETRWTFGQKGQKVALAVLYGGSVLLALLNHYFAGFAVLAQGVYSLLRLRGPALRWWSATLTLALLLFGLTWGWTLSRQLGLIRNQPWLLEATPDHAWQTLLRLADLPFRLLVQTAPFTTNVWWSAVGLLLFGVAVWGARRVDRRLTLLFAVWFCMPALGFAATDLVTGKATLAHLRYPAIALPGIAGLLALALVGMRPVLRWPLLIGLVVAAALQLRLPIPRHPLARVTAERLASLVGPDDLVIFDAVDWPRYWVPHVFVTTNHYAGRSPYSVLLLEESPSDGVRAELRRFAKIAVVCPRIDPMPVSVPETHRLLQEPEFVRGTAWILLYGKANGDNTGGSPPG